MALKNNAPFFSCVTRINNVLIDDCQDLDIVMPMYNLTSYSKNYQKTTASLWNYYRDEPNSGTQNNINYSIKDSKSFDYKKGLVGKLEDNNIELENIKIAVPIKYLSKFLRILEIPLIKCEICLNLKWSKSCVLTSQATRAADPNADPPVVQINNPTDAEFNITDCKLYVPAITLPTLYENILHRKLKEGFSIDVYWDRYRSQMTNQKAGLINYLIDPTIDNLSRLFVLAYENEDGRSDFKNYYLRTRKITDYNVLIDQQPFFELPIRNKKETYERIVDVYKNLNDYTKGNLFSYDYFSNHYKLILVDLAKQNISLDKQQTNFNGKLNEDATVFFIIEESKITTLKFSQNFVDIV